MYNNRTQPQIINPNHNSIKPNDIIKISSWNVEDFVMINKLLKNYKLLSRLKDQDIILVQEWNNKDRKGELFVHELQYFSYVSIDRVAVLYNTNLFDINKTKVYELKLEHEEPSYIEKRFTSGRQKSNILTILYPINKDYKPLCIISFHLSAYIPSHHPGFHKKQLTQLIKKAIKIIYYHAGIIDYNIIIGGDTNYRITNRTINKINLKNELINNNKLKEQLTNVCTNKCTNKYTQSFSCVHEESINKKIAYTTSYFFDKTRLDLMLTNLKVINAIVDNELCDLSDHSMILAELEYIPTTTKTTLTTSNNINCSNYLS